MPWSDKDALTPQALNSRSGLVFNVKDPEYGATGDGTTDDTTALQAALDAAETDGGTIYVPQGTYGISATLTVANTVTLLGAGSSASEIKALSTFPDNGKMINLGNDVAGSRSWLRHIRINADSRTGCVNVYSSVQQEGAIENITCRLVVNKGIHFEATGGNAPANATIRDVEIQFAVAASSARGIHLEDLTGGHIRIINITVSAAGGASVQDAGIDCDNSNAFLTNIAPEKVTDGIRVSRDAVIVGYTGQVNVTNAIRIKTGAGNVVVIGAHLFTGTNVLNNDITGLTLTQSRLSWYVFDSVSVTDTYLDDAGHLISNIVQSRVGPLLNLKAPGTYGGTLAMTDQRLQAVAVYVPPGLTWDRISAHVQNAGASGSVIRLGIYLDNGNGVPGALLLDAGTIDGTSATSQQITISQVIREPIVWLAAVAQGTPAGDPTMFSVAPFGPIVSSDSNLNVNRIVARHNASISGALPATFTAEAVRDSAGVAIRLRRSA